MHLCCCLHQRKWIDFSISRKVNRTVSTATKNRMGAHIFCQLLRCCCLLCGGKRPAPCAQCFSHLFTGIENTRIHGRKFHQENKNPRCRCQRTLEPDGSRWEKRRCIRLSVKRTCTPTPTRQSLVKIYRLKEFVSWQTPQELVLSIEQNLFLPSKKRSEEHT